MTTRFAEATLLKEAGRLSVDPAGWYHVDSLSNESPTFTIDTHLFRELGELLVGRDSTALVELIKNAYDADATEVVVHGDALDDPRRGFILITDNGVGMSAQQFRLGFLRIASRVKEEARRSPKFKRRYTGAKGVGRLAAHKLAWLLQVQSTSNDRSAPPIAASINWAKIEELKTFDEIPTSGAVEVVEGPASGSKSQPGTVIVLRNLKRKWTPAERTRFLAEAQTFSVPQVLLKLPSGLLPTKPLISTVRTRDAKGDDPGFEVKLEGDFNVGDEYWHNVASAASWIIEIDASSDRETVEIAITPAKRTLESAHRDDRLRQRRFKIPHPNPSEGPFFHSRILIREGRSGSREQQQWLGRMSGIRVYVEGFRVLPYGEPSDDWLEVDQDYASRPKTLTFLKHLPSAGPEADQREGLLFLQNQSYFGGVFLTLDQAKSLQMLVNREGFVPGPAFDAMSKIVRTAIHLSVRVRAAASIHQREVDRKRIPDQGKDDSIQEVASRQDLRELVERAASRAVALAADARLSAASGNFTSAKAKIDEAAAQFLVSSAAHQRLMTEGSVLRVLASVGTQMAAFVHEIKGLLAAAEAIEASLSRVRKNKGLTVEARQTLAQLHSAVGDLRRAVERQASFLMDVTSPDARRRRSRQSVAARFEAAKRLVLRTAERRGVEIENLVPPDLKSPPMFPAELTVLFTNLLSNAIKNAGEPGRVRATAKVSPQGGFVFRMENTGISVDLDEAERWFKPFESTTAEADPVLGQGMGMGLPITRNMLEEYGGRIRFVRPTRGFATAIEFSLPE